MENRYCLNCHEAVERNYCSNCGQKTNTHRINFKHFIFHDILHGVWHYEKGIFFTIKEAITRPGKSAIDYISGKRIKYYNVFYLILLLVGFTILLGNYYSHLENKYSPSLVIELPSGNSDQFGNFLANYAKILILSLIPLFAINSFILFRRRKFNLSEHFIISGMSFLGVILIAFLSIAISFLDFTKNFDIISFYIDKATPIILLIYISFSYYNAFQSDYKKFGLVWRIALFLTLLCLELFLSLKFLESFFIH